MTVHCRHCSCALESMQGSLLCSNAACPGYDEELLPQVEVSLDDDVVKIAEMIEEKAAKHEYPNYERLLTDSIAEVRRSKFHVVS